MPVKDQAAYMREYRKRHKAADDDVLDDVIGTARKLIALRTENARLVEEVAHLKRELAARPGVAPGPLGRPSALTPALPGGRRSPVEYRPVPKPGSKK